METKLNIIEILKRTFITIFKSWRQLFAFVLTFQLAATILFKPLIQGMLTISMQLKGYPILINSEIREFFFSITGIIVGLLVLIVATVLVYYEFSTVMHIVKYHQQGSRHTVLHSVEAAVFSFNSLKSRDSVGFMLYAIIFMPFFSFGIQSSLLPALSVPNFVLLEIEKYPAAIIFILLLFALGGFLSLRLILVFPIMVFQQKTFLAAASESFWFTRKNWFRILITIGIVATVAMGAAMLPVVLFMQLRGAIFLPFKALSAALMFVVSSIFPAMVICTSLSCYEAFVPGFKVHADTRVDELDSKIRRTVRGLWELIKRVSKNIYGWFYRVTPHWLSRKPYLFIIFLVVPIIVFVDIYIPLKLELEPIKVVGHRGSLDGVENTTQAMEGAIAQGADYAEIDVLLSKDGVPMVIHDISLNRLARVGGNVYDLTAAELGELTLRDRGYTGKISTLAEICAVSDGRIKLMIEIKTHGRETESVLGQTTKVVADNQMEDQVIYQTGTLDILEDKKRNYSQLEMGYIVFGYVGRMSAAKIIHLGADFLSVEETFITSALVKSAHRAGRPVYVWSVNHTDNVGAFHSLDVDGIITDYPQNIRDALRQLELEGSAG